MKMSLKEAFRYQKYLSNSMEGLNSYLNTKNVVKIKETHYFSKTNDKKDDIIKEIINERPFECDVIDVIDLYQELLDIKESLTDAIAKAKNKAKFNIDTAIAMNQEKQYFVERLKSLANLKNGEQETTKTDYKFDVEGKETSYRYPMTTVVEIDFDRDAIKAISKRLLIETDKKSTEIDEIKVGVKFDFETPYDVTDTLEDMIYKFKNKTK